MIRKYVFEKTCETNLAHSYNKKVRNNQCKLLGVTLIIAYLSFHNKAGEFHEKYFTLENVLRTYIK